MKKTMSIQEFKDYCKNKKLRSILYTTENQNWYSIATPCKMELSFSTMLIAENPNVIYLKSGSNSLFIGRVKAVNVDTECSVLGSVFTVFCGDMRTQDADNTYTLVATS